jgi:hypothetical protein
MFVKTIEILHKETSDANRLPLPYIEFGFQKFNLYFISDHIPPLLKIRHLWQLKIDILKHWCLICAVLVNEHADSKVHPTKMNFFKDLAQSYKPFWIKFTLPFF